ncbi:MAG: DUF1778 domain-containing protein [Moraxella sp.]
MYALRTYKGNIKSATERISLRTTPQAKALIEQTSQQMGVSMSHFILTTMYQKSLELLQASQKLQSVWLVDNNQDKMLIKDILDNSPPPTPEMLELLKLTESIEDFT